MSTEERRALALIAALLVLTAAARYLERPKPVLEDEPALDLAALEAASRAPAKSSGPMKPLDPNTASPSELDRLPGVGPALAQQIVAERGRARFVVLEDLRRVRGVGDAMLEKLAPHVSLKRGGDVRGGEAWRAAATTSQDRSVGVTAGPLDLNAATVTTLQQIHGIGPALAERLMARRDSLGHFSTWDDVDAVTGVGPAILARLRENAVLRH
ncbi:MAG TPA: helix-hairpin-helix domain-containing protein [Longimicrobiales bacterium]|nr:helix-hairpin-helix domain-containing protein [Longimicrobiales bacterium]